MADYICLFFDADGIVRATDTIIADTVHDASEKAHALLRRSTGLAYVELWQNRERVFQTPGHGEGQGSGAQLISR